MTNLWRIMVFALLAAICSPIAAQENNGTPQQKGPRQPATFDGAWQLCIFQQGESGEYEVKLLPVLKLIAPDGSYTNLLLGGDNKCGIAEQGTYTKVNDSTLTETPKAGRHNEETPAGQQITFNLQGPQWMVIDRTEEGKKVHEIWMRLRQFGNGKQMVKDLIAGKSPQEVKPEERRPGGQGGQRQGGRNRNRMPQMPDQNNSGEENSWMNED